MLVYKSYCLSSTCNASFTGVFTIITMTVTLNIIHYQGEIEQAFSTVSGL